MGAQQRILRGITIPPRSIRTSPAIGSDERVQHLREVLLHDQLPMHYRLIGAFVLLFGQSLSRIVTLTRDQVDVDSPATRLLLVDNDWIDLPEPIATLLLSYLEDGWNTRTAASPRPNPRHQPRTAMQHATRAGTDYQAYAAERAREEQN